MTSVRDEHVQQRQMSGSHSRMDLPQGHEDCVEQPSFLQRQPDAGRRHTQPHAGNTLLQATNPLSTPINSRFSAQSAFRPAVSNTAVSTSIGVSHAAGRILSKAELTKHRPCHMCPGNHLGTSVDTTADTRRTSRTCGCSWRRSTSPGHRDPRACTRRTRGTVNSASSNAHSAIPGATKTRDAPHPTSHHPTPTPSRTRGSTDYKVTHVPKTGQTSWTDVQSAGSGGKTGGGGAFQATVKQFKQPANISAALTTIPHPPPHSSPVPRGTS